MRCVGAARDVTGMGGGFAVCRDHRKHWLVRVVSACVLAGVWLTLRHRSQRAFEIPEMIVDVTPDELHAGEQFLVTLRVDGEKASTIRWWSAELMAEVEGRRSEDDRQRGVCDRSGRGSVPVSELQMVLETPSAATIRDANSADWWVRVTVETDRGRMEREGRVAGGAVTQRGLRCAADVRSRLRAYAARSG